MSTIARKKSKPAKTQHAVLDLDGFIPAYISQIGNRWSRGSSRLYLKSFGVGINEWRVMTIVAREPGVTAQRASEILGSDKAAIARGIFSMEKHGLVKVEPSEMDRRQRHVFLTDLGWEVHDKILKVALDREALLLDGLTKGEIGDLTSLLDRVRKNLVRLHLDEG